MVNLRTTAALIAALFISGCSEYLPQAPVPESIDPPTAPEGTQTAITITGRNFFPGVKVSYKDKSHSSLDTAFTARLGDTSLTEVVYVDSGTLTATVPATLAPGIYDLTVADPEGRTGMLADAFNVTPENCSDIDDDCDNVDDDCDGTADDDYVPTATNCGTGVCAATGQLECQSGSEVDTCTAGSPTEDLEATCDDNLDNDCDGATDSDDTDCPVCADTDETCDNVDDDCDGTTDDDYVPTPTNCGTGVCASTGQLECQNGMEVDTCAPVAVGEDPEVTCDDNLDNDCDGATDADDTDCPVCTATDETCDNVDDDCDGTTDDDYIPTPTNCGTGVCAATGQMECQAGSEVDTCAPGSPTENPEATCDDNLDNDCDGATDLADVDCGAVNTPPLPAIMVTPPAGLPAETYTASAVGTTDREDDPLDLIYRWDWENDGTFEDTGVEVSRSFSPGPRVLTVVLQVEDTGGLVAYATFFLVLSNGANWVVVTTELDESDAGATPGNPGGTGLSLREAIDYTDGLAGTQNILVPAGMEILLTGTIGGPSDPDGVRIIADGASLDGSGLGGNTNCIQVSSGGNSIFGLEIKNCPGFGIQVSGGPGNRFSRCYLHDNVDGATFTSDGNIFGPYNEVAFNSEWSIYVNASTEFVQNNFHDNVQMGLRMVGGAGSLVRNNTFIRNNRGVWMGVNNDGVQFINNTFHANTLEGIQVFNSVTNVDLRNNNFSSNGTYAVTGSDSNFAFIDYNNYFDNPDGACDGCSTTGANSLADDPQYINSAQDDLRMFHTSPLIDAGLDLGYDLNGPAAGNFTPTAPDIGAWEAPY